MNMKTKVIEWNEDIAPLLDDEGKKQLFLSLLGRGINVPWKGKICRREKVSVDYHAPFVELRKRIGDADVLMRVGLKRPTPWSTLTAFSSSPVVEISMNAKAQFQPSDLTEVSLVADEAMSVYNAISRD